MTILAILAALTLVSWAMVYLLFGGTDDDDHDDWKGYT